MDSTLDTTLKINNIVLIATFEQSDFDKYFFIKNEIIREDEIGLGSRFDGVFETVVSTVDYHIAIRGGAQIIITEIKPDISKSIVNEVLYRILKTGIIKSYTGIGFNFHWFMEDKTKPLHDLSNRFFFNEKSSLQNLFFSNPDSLHGIYCSTNFKDARLKMEAKPIITIEEVEGEEKEISGYTFVFNFHFVIPDSNSSSEVYKFLSDYPEYKAHNQSIISIYN